MFLFVPTNDNQLSLVGTNKNMNVPTNDNQLSLILAFVCDIYGVRGTKHCFKATVCIFLWILIGSAMLLQLLTWVQVLDCRNFWYNERW